MVGDPADRLVRRVDPVAVLADTRPAVPVQPGVDEVEGAPDGRLDSRSRVVRSHDQTVGTRRFGPAPKGGRPRLDGMYDVDLAAVGALLGNPSRAAMLDALMTGRALTAAELARVAGVSAPTASEHLAKLREGGLRGGRVAGAAPLPPAGVRRRRGSPRVALARRPRATGDAPCASRAGRVAGRGAHLLRPPGGPMRGRPARRPARARLAGARAGWLRPLRARVEGAARVGCRPDDGAAARARSPGPCLDWTERREHLAGSLAAAVATAVMRARTHGSYGAPTTTAAFVPPTPGAGGSARGWEPVAERPESSPGTLGRRVSPRAHPIGVPVGGEGRRPTASQRPEDVADARRERDRCPCRPAPTAEANRASGHRSTMRSRGTRASHGAGGELARGCRARSGGRAGRHATTADAGIGP